MNPLVDPIHAGLAGISMEVSEFDLGEGVVLKQTFAHFMAPFLMAFGPAEEGRPHPAPWSLLAADSDLISMSNSSSRLHSRGQDSSIDLTLFGGSPL